MKQSKKNAFTLIELVAVLVIMAIIALIVTPLVMSIIRKARISADKRSIDAYGRSIELAIAGYLMDNGSFPTSIEQLTIEYSGDEVVCTTTQLNSDSSVYLAECQVAGRSVEGYTYGKEEKLPIAYSVGDEVTYNGVDYYVIENSGTTESTVKLLKAEPLTVAEVNQYGGVGTANNHVNMYNASSSDSYYQTAYDVSGYGGMAYYTSETCGLSGRSLCTNEYVKSEIKYVVDTWAATKAPAASEARLIAKDEYIVLCEEEKLQSTPSDTYIRYIPKYNWMYNSNYWYWTNTPNADSQYSVWVVNNYDGGFSARVVDGDYDKRGVVRPVIVLPKSAI